MKLERLGCGHQTRLSFMRALLRRLKRENWRFNRPVWKINDRGEGCAVYSAKGPRHTYSLVAFSRDLPRDLRSDRVIATAWDATFCLYDGVPDDDEIERLRQNVPLQEAGRISDRELSLSRANKSVRLWTHVLENLSNGMQPEAEQVEAVGYLMRTTAVYGSGKFGAADRWKIENRDLAGGAFRIEMLSVYLTRAFTLDLIEHMAKAQGGDKAVTIDPVLRRRFGIGNSTGLGMAPFLINHPALLDRWIMARETALARVRSLETAPAETQRCFAEYLERATINAAHWQSAHPIQLEKIAGLRADLAATSEHIKSTDVLSKPQPWNELYKWAENNLSLEGQEQLVAILLEPHGELIDDLTTTMGADEYSVFSIDGSQRVSEFRALLENNYAWALNIEYDSREESARFWYVSEEKLEPRLGERYEEPGAEYEQPIDTGRGAARLYQALSSWSDDEELAAFLLAHPEHRHLVRRVQLQHKHPYAEIQDNLISNRVLPIDILRCKLAFFGATRFDPRSDRWVRICMYQNAPFPSELANNPADDWAYPLLEE